jgi:hypothetical protein
MVRGHTTDRVVVPLDPGPHTVTVRTWDEYPGRETTGPIGQESERISVAGRTTPDLADGVARPEWSDAWTWTSPGQLEVVHEHGGTGWQSLWFEVCATPTPPETTTTTTTTTVPVLEPDAPPVTDTPPPVEVPVEVLPETVVAVPVKERPAFTG